MPSDKWLRFTTPEIPELVLDGPMIVPADETAEFTLQVTFEGEPYPEEALDTLQYCCSTAPANWCNRATPSRSTTGCGASGWPR
jgi:hypothetical protein